MESQRILSSTIVIANVSTAAIINSAYAKESAVDVRVVGDAAYINDDRTIRINPNAYARYGVLSLLSEIILSIGVGLYC